MLPVFVAVIAVSLLFWLLSVLVFRNHPWAFAGWMPATALAFAGSLLFVIALVASRRGSGGAAHGFYAIGLATVVVPMLFPAPLFLGLSWHVRPRVEPSDGALMVGTVTATGLMLFFFYLAHGSVPK